MIRLQLAWRLANGPAWRALGCGLTVAASFLLLGITGAIDWGLRHAGRPAQDDRLIVVNRHAVSQSLPLTLADRIGSVPGVAAVSPRQWFGGWYREPTQGFVQYVVDPAADLRTHPEYRLDDRARQDFLAGGNAVLVGRALAGRFGWQAGDNIRLHNDIWLQPDGNSAWDLRIAGVFDVAGGQAPAAAADAQTLLLGQALFAERLPYARHLAGWFVVAVAPGADPQAVAQAIDSGFDASATPTASSSERLFAQRMTRQLGDAAHLALAVAAAVVAALLCSVCLACFQNLATAHDRVRLLNALGFSHRRVAAQLLLGTLTHTLAYAALGLLLAWLVVPPLARQLVTVLPGMWLPPATLGQALALAAALGLCGALAGWIGLAPVRRERGSLP